MDVSSFSDEQLETLAILLSEGFDYNTSYEASIFYPKDTRRAREYANSRQNIPRKLSLTCTMRIKAVCENMPSLKFHIEISDPRKKTLQMFISELEQRWYSKKILDTWSKTHPNGTNCNLINKQKGHISRALRKTLAPLRSGESPFPFLVYQ